MKVTIPQVLTEAKKYICRSERWIKGESERRVLRSGDWRNAYCASGAVCQALYNLVGEGKEADTPLSRSVFRRLDKATKKYADQHNDRFDDIGDDIVALNDHRLTRHVDVMRVFDMAIAGKV